jgi:hypothetical protein
MKTRRSTIPVKVNPDEVWISGGCVIPWRWVLVLALEAAPADATARGLRELKQMSELLNSRQVQYEPGSKLEEWLRGLNRLQVWCSGKCLQEQISAIFDHVGITLTQEEMDRRRARSA